MDARLRDFATTDRQREMFDLVAELGSGGKAAERLGVDRSAVNRTIQLLRERAAASGIAPDQDLIHQTAPGFTVKRISTNYKDGDISQQWVIQEPAKQEQFERFREMIAEMCEEVKGKAPAIPAPAYTDADLITVIPMGDPHCGMRAWAAETGEDFDLEIFETRLTRAIDRLVDATPPSEQALFINLGDMFHADSSSNRTPASGHALDVDGRFAKVALVAFRSMVYAINRLREKHARVTVWNRPGNHDPHSYLMLAMSLNAYFHNDPRVDVPVDPCHFSYMRFGRCLFASTHGHGPKIADLPMIMASDRKEDWGRTDHRTWFIGHFHHKQIVKDLTGCTVEIARTLAGSDAWHHAEGYRSAKDMQAIVFHRDFGELERHTCGLAMLR